MIRRFNVTDLSVKSDEATGQRLLSGYGSTFEEPSRHDSYGDIIAPGAFDRVVELVNAGERRIKMLDNHGKAVGLWTKLMPDSKGLWVEGFVSRIPEGDNLITLVNDKVYDGLSIGFRTDTDLTRYRDLDVMSSHGFPVREWTSVDLREVSPTPFPSNEYAELVEARSMRLKAYEQSRRSNNHDDQAALLALHMAFLSASRTTSLIVKSGLKTKRF